MSCREWLDKSIVDRENDAKLDRISAVEYLFGVVTGNERALSSYLPREAPQGLREAGRRV
jgi:hypothetical protein